MQNIAFTGLTQAMTVLIAEHMHFLFLILKKSEMNGYTVLTIYTSKKKGDKLNENYKTL